MSAAVIAARRRADKALLGRVAKQLAASRCNPAIPELIKEISEWIKVGDVLAERIERREKLLKRYLDNHCANADAEGMSALCECQLCLDTRGVLRV